MTSTLPQRAAAAKEKLKDPAIEPPRSRIISEAIPPSMKCEDRWVLWRYDVQNGKRSKVLYQVDCRHKGSSSDSTTWASFDSVLCAYEFNTSMHGIGFVLGDGWFGIDLDKCRDPDSGEAHEDAKTIMGMVDGYWEISPSGTGFKWIGRGSVPNDRKIKLTPESGIEVEIYSKQYFTVTSRIMSRPCEVVDGTQAVIQIVDMFGEQHKQPEKREYSSTYVSGTNSSEDDIETAIRCFEFVPAFLADDYDQWIRLGQAAKSVSDRVKDAWIAWSRKGVKFNSDEECEYRWSTFKPSGITIATLVKIAKENGYEPTRQNRPKTPPMATRGTTPWTQPPKTQGKNGVSGYVPNIEDDFLSHGLPDFHDYKPFPIHLLPEAASEFVSETAKATCSDPSIVAMGVLTGLDASIGNSCVLQLKRGSWYVPSSLWCAVVADSGSNKTAPIRLALEPITRKQSEWIRDFQSEYEQFEKDQELYEKEKSEYRKSKDKNGTPPEPPSKPICKRIVVSDATIEALGRRHVDNPRGLLLYSDELTAWFASFARYRGKNSQGDESNWLSLYSGCQSIIDRNGYDSKSGGVLVIPKANVSIIGGVQPAIIRKSLTSEYKASGLAARILWTMPPPRKRQWTDDEVGELTLKRMESLYGRLLELPFDIGDAGELNQNIIIPSSDARREFIDFYNSHNDEQFALTGDLKSAYSKLEEVAARLALIIHCCERGFGPLELSTMQRAIELTQWFKNEAHRVYGILDESDRQFENRSILHWMQAKSTPITPRDLFRRFRSLGPVRKLKNSS